MRGVEKAYNPYTDLSPQEYVALMDAINRKNITNLKCDLANFPANHTSICFTVTGSDGKLERHPQSRTELIIFSTHTYAPSQLLHQFLDWYKKTHSKPAAQRYMLNFSTRMPEIKYIGGSIPLSYAWGQATAVYPDRTLTATRVIGNQELLNKAKRQVLTEATADDKQGKQIRAKMRDQLAEYRRNLERGVFHKHETFTLEPPLQLYDENPPSYTVGFKTSGLRAVQRKLDILTLLAIKNGSLTLTEAAQLPTGTLGRIDELKKRDIIPKQLPIDDSYSWFLQKYHPAQEQHRIKKTGVAVPFPKEQFLHHRQVVLEFLELSKGKPL
jgi:hypothetical protein